MGNFNKVILLGYLTRDPEIRYATNGTAIATTSIATNHNWTTEAGEKKEEVMFIELVCFGRSAGNFAQYAKKGTEVMIDGRLQLQTWDDKTTQAKRQKHQIVVNGFHLCGRRGRAGEEGEAPTPPPKRPTSAPTQTKSPIEEEDVPW